MQSWIFSIITPVFRVTWSSEIILIWWFAAQETFLTIVNVKNSFCCLIFYDQDSFRILCWIESSKQHLFVTLYIAFLSLLINSMHPCWIKVLIYLRKNILTPIFWTVAYFPRNYQFLMLSIDFGSDTRKLTQNFHILTDLLIYI